jgi:ABC-type uncharacterized transport system auxiliary subunit
LKILKLFYYLLFFIILIGCGGIPLTHYYRIDYAMPSGDSPRVVLPVTISVNQFESDVLYDEDRIVYRNSPYEIQYYHYHRWIDSPKKIVQEIVLKHLQSSGVFQRVVNHSEGIKSDYILFGKITGFEELDEGNSWYGLIQIAFRIQDQETKAILWENEFTQKTAAAKQEPAEVVKALSMSLKNVVEKAVGEMAIELRK